MTLRSRLIVTLLIGGIALACGRSDRGSAPARNVLLITIDTLRADHLGAYGSRAGTTPHLDRLAARGVVFEQAFTTAPLTLPAHASLLSGLWPFHHGARVNGADGIAADAPLLAARLSKAGFATAAVVGSLVLRSETGLARGFDLYDDRFAENAGRPARDWNARRRGDEVVDRAAGWLDGVGRRRFFLWVHLYDPHAPYEPPSPYRERFPGRPYEGGVAYADACLGRLMARLEEKGLLGETLVAVAGDHGESLGEHGETTHGVFLYDATLRVPLLLVDPGRKARHVSAPVSLADVAPTLAEAAGLPPAPADGLSLWPLAAGNRDAPHRVYAESVYPAALLGWSPLFAVRSERAKYIEAPRPELYDLARDSGERQNVFSPSHEEARSLARRLASIRATGRATRVSAPGGAEAVSRLASLGYLTPSSPEASLEAVDALRTDPKNGIHDWDRIERAIIARQSGRPREGAALLEEVVAEGREASATVLRELAQCERQSGRIERAAAVYERIIRDGAAVAEDFFRLGVCWHILGKEERAERAHAEAVRLDPRDLDAWIDLGQERLALARTGAAKDAFSAALRIDPRSIDALAGLAASAFDAGDYATAAARLREALAVAPDRPEILENLARVERRRGNPEEARRLEERLSSLRGESRPAVHSQLRGQCPDFHSGTGKGGSHEHTG
jgi:arylsulfatase A-like enzyme/Flp pilus assembly protein TadD